MDILIWLLIGGLIGCISSMITHQRAQQVILQNICIGMVGALLGGWLITPLLRDSITMKEQIYNAISILLAIIGAVFFLALINIFRRKLNP